MDIKELARQLRLAREPIRHTAASTLEVMASEVERLKATFDAGTVAQILKVTQARAEAAEAERDRLANEVEVLKHDIARHMAIANEAVIERDHLKAVGQKLLAKLDHPTASVTQWDADELRAALGDVPHLV